MLPQVAQGALAVECRDDDDATTRPAVAHRARGRVALAVDGERAFLAELGGGCDLPVGAHVVAVDDGWRCEGLIADLAGTTVLRHAEVGRDPVSLGAASHGCCSTNGAVRLSWPGPRGHSRSIAAWPSSSPER